MGKEADRPRVLVKPIARNGSSCHGRASLDLEQERLNESITPVPAMTTSTWPTTYDTDFYTWTQEQAELLRQGRFLEVDLENVIEEIESLGRSERRSFVSAIYQLTQHLLKWPYQSGKQTPSWRATIREQRRQITLLLQDNPSFKAQIKEAMAGGYADGRKQAADETGLPLATFPEICPYTWEQLTDEDWLPDY